MMKLKKYNLYQKSAGVLQGCFVGSIWATSYKVLDNITLFRIEDTIIASMVLFRVEECIIDD